MDTCNSHAKFVCQTQDHQEINKITYRKSQQTLSLTSILSFSGILTENWNIKYIKNQINNLSILIKVVLTLMQRSMQFWAAYFTGFAKITSRTKKNTQMNINERYQGHAKALSKAGLALKVYPTLNEIWKKADASKLNKNAKWEKWIGGKNVISISV